MVNGTLAERLGSGLQHHLQRFESARYLFKIPKLLFKRLGIFFMISRPFPDNFSFYRFSHLKIKTSQEKLRSF